MTDDHTHEPLTRSIPAVETKRYLLGFLEESAAVSKLRSPKTLGDPLAPFEPGTPPGRDAPSDADYRALWQEATESIVEPPPFHAHEVELEPLPDAPEIEEHLAAFEGDPHFQRSLGSYADRAWSIDLVPLDRLVAFQPSIATSAYGADIAAAAGDLLDVLEVTLPVDPELFVEYQRIRDTHFTGIQYVSRSPNLHLSGPKHRHPDRDDTVFGEVTFQVKTDPNFLYVARFEDRYILKNGYHRAYQLLSHGETHVPAVVIDAESYGKTGGDKSGFFDRSVVMGERPPLLSDFRTDAAIDLERRAKNRVIRIVAETTDVLR